jgi:hypothetical protein
MQERTSVLPNLITRLLSGGALWRATARRASAPVKRVDSWLAIGWARMNRLR